MHRDMLTDALSHEQQTQLTAWLAQRNARVAAQNHRPPLQENLADRLRALDAAFARSPDRDEAMAQENHELRRTVEIYEEALRQLINGQLPLYGPTNP